MKVKISCCLYFKTKTGSGDRLLIQGDLSALFRRVAKAASSNSNPETTGLFLREKAGQPAFSIGNERMLAGGLQLRKSCVFPMLNELVILRRLLSGPTDVLDRINEELQSKGLPPYYLGLGGFSVEYRIANKPRFLWKWKSLSLELDELYLYYMPPIEGREPTKEDEIVLKL